MKTSIIKILLASGFGLLSALSASAQMKVGANPTTIDPSAVLQVDAITGGTKQGFLLPRVALTNTTAFAPLASHVAGMTVYNTATAGDVTPGYYYNDGIKWVKVSGAGAEPWFSTATNTGSVLNTEKIYYKGKAAIGNFNTDPDVMQFYGLTNSSSLLAVQGDAVNSDFLGGTTNTIVASRLLKPATDFSGGYIRNIHSLMHTTGSANYTSADIIGIAANNEHGGSGTITGSFVGLNADAQNTGSGTISNAIGVSAYMSNFSAGTIGTATGVSSNMNNYGKITNYYNFYARQGGDNANIITNSYGLYVNDLIGTNRWGVYQNGAKDKNYFAGRVGVGATDPDSTLFYGVSNTTFGVQKTVTDLTGYINGSATELAINPSAPATGLDVRGVHSLVHIQGSNNITGGTLYGVAANFVYEGSGTIDNFKTAGINLDYGINGGGRIKRGFGASINMGNGNGLIDNAYGLQVGVSGTNTYGVYISPTTFTSVGYGVYQEGASDNNYFAGNVGIGTATPTSKLQVVGLPVFATDAAAGTGGLTAGAFFQDATGIVHVKQ